MSGREDTKLVEILLVEDNPGDVLLTREALADTKLLNRLSVVPDGEQALAFLRGRGTFTGSQRPDLILLDLGLPKKDGREVLAEIKADPDLRSIPVCILTSSDAERDIVMSYDLGANCYVTKPIDFDLFLDVVKAVNHFWFCVVTLPQGPLRG
jgi:CheY-like chemotaxis protein